MKLGIEVQGIYIKIALATTGTTTIRRGAYKGLRAHVQQVRPDRVRLRIIDEHHQHLNGKSPSFWGGWKLVGHIHNFESHGPACGCRQRAKAEAKAAREAAAAAE